jgi:hypothetical protein
MKHNPSLPARVLQTSGMVPGLPVVCDPAVVLATWAGVLPRGDNENSMGRHCNEVGGVERLRLGRARALVALGRSRRPGNDDRPDGTVGTPLDPWHLPRPFSGSSHCCACNYRTDKTPGQRGRGGSRHPHMGRDSTDHCNVELQWLGWRDWREPLYYSGRSWRAPVAVVAAVCPAGTTGWDSWHEPMPHSRLWHGL